MTPEQRVQLYIGSLVFTLATHEATIDALTKRLAELEKTNAKSRPAPAKRR